MIGNDLEGVGGAIVRRTFTMAGARKMSGEIISLDELSTMPKNNRRALIDNRNIELYPSLVMHEGRAYVAQNRQGNRFGPALFDVIVGRKINDEPLTREEAHELAGVPLSD